MLTLLRTRILAAALLPVFVVSAATVAMFLSVRLDDLDAAHRQRGRLLVRQLAMASEYGLFSGNQASLLGVATAIGAEEHVRSVAVYDAQGALRASAGAWTLKSYGDAATAAQEGLGRDRGVDTLMEVVTPASVAVEDWLDGPAAKTAAGPPPVGYAVLELSREGLEARTRGLLFWTLALGLAGIVLAWLIAERMGQRVMQPVMQVSRRIAQIGEGDLSVEPPSGKADPLEALQLGLNGMAEQLRAGRDVLEQRVAEVTQELRLKKEEAEIATLAKSRFLAAASHDLRQPAHALGMLMARLGQLPMDAPMRELVHSAELAVQATQDLLDALLDISRLDAGSVVVEMRPVSTVALLEKVQLSLGAMATHKGLRLCVLPGRHWVLSDAVLLQRIVMNLAHNAVRYTERGSVLIACRPVGGGRHVRIDVRDSGIGISEEHQARIFQEFYQVGNAQRDRSYGLGLGLSIVERGARLLRHAVGLQSAPGCGTRFSITVPVATAPTVGDDHPQDLAAPGEGATSARVMVIEDDRLSLDAIRALLESWGYEVRAVPDLDQAVAALQDGFVPQVLVSDYRIGGRVSGMDAIARLSALAGCTIPACLISGDTDVRFIQAAKESGLALLHKPVRPAKLRSLLRRLAGEGQGAPGS